MYESRTGNVIKNSGAALIYKAVHMILQFILRTAFIKILGNEYTGISTLFTDILQVLSLMDLGIGTAMLYALYKPLEKNDIDHVNALMSFYKRAYTIIGIGVLLMGMAMMPFLHNLIKDVPNIHEDIRLIFFFYVLNSACSYFLVYKTSLLNATQNGRIISIVDSVIQTLETIIEVVLLLVFKQYFCYLIIHLLATLLRNIVLTKITFDKYPYYFRNNKATISKEEKKSLFKDIFALSIYKISGVMIYSTDSIVISAFVGTIQVSILGNFQMIINSIRMVIEQIINSLKPSVGNLVASSTVDNQKKVFDTLNFLCFWIAYFGCTCLYVLLNPFIGKIWFEESFMVSNDILIILVINFYIAIMVYPVETFRTSNGLFVQGKYRPAIMAVLNIILDIIFVQYWGVFGVYLATLISRLLTQCWYDPYLVFYNVFKKGLKKYYFEYLLYALITFFSCMITNCIANITSFGNNYIDFLYQIIVCIVTPNILFLILFFKSNNLKMCFNRFKYILKK